MRKEAVLIPVVSGFVVIVIVYFWDHNMLEADVLGFVVFALVLAFFF